MAQKVINNAENHLVVGSLEVIGDVTGSGIKTIRRSIESVTSTLKEYKQKQDDYWSEIANDGNITAMEKQILKKEWNSIVQTYTAIMQQAAEKSLTNKQAIIEYKQAYNNLYYYLYTTLKLFDEMDKTTEIDNRDTFNEYYSTYYAKENYTQLTLAIGSISGNAYRILSSLNEIGSENELAVYNAEIYQWKENKWIKVGTNGYVGVQRSLPTEITGNYFLAGDNFVADISFISPEGKEYISPEGEAYLMGFNFIKAKIYEYNGSQWVIAADSDYRYLVTMTDYFELTGTFPPSWRDFIATQLDDAVEQMTEEMQAAIEKLRKETNDKIDNIHVTSYLGSFESDPEDAAEGDWYCYSGVETTQRQKGYMYIYLNSSWVKLNPESTENSKYYMAGLKDCLDAADTTDVGHFNVIFASAFFANTAVLNKLGVHQIVIQDQGSIISEGYVAGSEQPGFNLDGATGKLQCSGAEISGKIITGDGSEIRGTCIVDKLHFNKKYKLQEIVDFKDGDIWMM